MIEGTEAGKCFKLGQVTEAEETQKGGISPIRLAPSADAAEGDGEGDTLRRPKRNA